MKKKVKISKFRFGEGGEIAPGVVQLSELSNLNSFLTELDKESDRSVVLVASSFFDEALSIRLRKHLKHGNKQVLDSLLDLNGPLSSFASKIDISFCLGDIPKAVRDDLHVIRKMRNYCAHNWSSFVIDEEMESKYLSKLNTRLASCPDAVEKFEPFNTDMMHPRSKFIVICGMISLQLSLFVDKDLEKRDKGADI